MRPKIICHMVSSIDGRLQSNRWTPLLQGNTSEQIMSIYEETASELNGSAWIVGRKTMASMVSGDFSGTSLSDSARQRPAHIGIRAGRNLAVVIDPRGKLSYSSDTVGADHLVTILSERVTDQYLEHLQAVGVSYLFAGEDGSDLHKAIEELRATFDIETLLLEGGGLINGAFLKADLIDEFSVLMFPGVDGLSGISSILEYQGQYADELPAKGRSLRLLAAEKLTADFVWLRYEVVRQKA